MARPKSLGKVLQTMVSAEVRAQLAALLTGPTKRRRRRRKA
jgi:hypothetical protein